MVYRNPGSFQKSLLHTRISAPLDQFFLMCIKFHIFTHRINDTSMRTNIELDDQLVKQALQISNLKTKKDVVHEALKQYVASLMRKKLLSLREKGTWDGDLEQMRSL